MLRLRWLLCVTLIVLAVTSLLQPADATRRPSSRGGRGSRGSGSSGSSGSSGASSSGSSGATGASAGAGRGSRNNGGNGGSGGTGNRQTAQPSGNGLSSTGGRGNRGRGSSGVSGSNGGSGSGQSSSTGAQSSRRQERRQRSFSLVRNGQRPPADSLVKERPSRANRNKKWRNRKRQRPTKKNKVDGAKNGTLSSILSAIKEQIKEEVDELKETVKEELKERSKQVVKDLLESMVTDLSTGLCECVESTCQCCVNWGVLGNGCMRVEVYNEPGEPAGVDVIVEEGRGEEAKELASITVDEDTVVEPEDACFTLIPYISDVCISPKKFSSTSNGDVEAQISIKLEGFSLRGTYLASFKNKKLSMLGTKFSPLESMGLA